ncbi:MAG: class I SAM-dependent methyltransferase [Ardenticatenaceae bacterium]|nr:class I SAM-dependent methyltransferase [Anaerolineales bacterium]MCB8941566.1 class I SAM-dependent methyltransferase [Ardenticatenaceae bacterium]MCB8974540.1 class I SAM-dependent methyltransferase [Ardenticatenaceae bacterium]
MNVQQAYDTWSGTYDDDHNLTRDLDRMVMVQTLAGRPFPSILELGCGTGKNTGFLAQLGETVTAVDFSPGMLAQAQAKIAAPHVTFQVMDITQPWPTPAGAFELITCNLILEHIESLDFVMQQVHRALKPGGLLFISELHPFRQYLGGQARFTQDEQTTFIPSFVHHISDFMQAARQHGLSLQNLKEWWHDDDEGKPPRLISFLFQK